jgi:ribosomal protein S18 acetylase RimI-like enzyme
MPTGAGDQSGPDLFAEYRPRQAQPGEGRSLPAGFLTRQATIADLDGLAALASARSGATIEKERAGFGRELAATKVPADNVLLVAEIPPVIVGLARARYFRPPADAPAKSAPAGWYLAGLIVSAAHRRRGIGALLTQRRLLWIAVRADEAFYFANARNRVSHDLHARFGFAELSRDFVYPGVTFTGGAGILYRAVLSDPSKRATARDR